MSLNSIEYVVDDFDNVAIRLLSGIEEKAAWGIRVNSSFINREGYIEYVPFSADEYKKISHSSLEAALNHFRLWVERSKYYVITERKYIMMSIHGGNREGKLLEFRLKDDNT